MLISDIETVTGRNFRLSTAAPRHIRTAPQKLHSQLVGLVTAIMYQMTVLTCSFVYSIGLQRERVIQNNLAGYTNLFLHARPTNQSTIPVV
jgi:hypothetical protein